MKKFKPDIPKLKVVIKGYDSYNVELVAAKVINLVASMPDKGMEVINPIPLPNIITKRAILRSPFKHKKSFEHFGQITHRRLIYVLRPETKLLVNLTSLNYPASVKVHVKYKT